MHNNRASISSAREITCWVPNCKNTSNGDHKLIYLPDNPKSREKWLALAGKAITSPEEQIYFCSEHFSVSFLKVHLNVCK